MFSRVHGGLIFKLFTIGHLMGFPNLAKNWEIPNWTFAGISQLNVLNLGKKSQIGHLLELLQFNYPNLAKRMENFYNCQIAFAKF